MCPNVLPACVPVGVPCACLVLRVRRRAWDPQELGPEVAVRVHVGARSWTWVLEEQQGLLPADSVFSFSLSFTCTHDDGNKMQEIIGRAGSLESKILSMLNLKCHDSCQFGHLI